MDDRTETAVETTLQTELLYNERIVNHPTFGAVRLTRPTPGQERLVAEARRKQITKDMRDPDVMSKDQWEQLAIEKGMWAPHMSDRVIELTRKTGEAMALLERFGFKSFEECLEEFRLTVVELLSLYKENEEIRDVVSAYFDLDQLPQTVDRGRIIDAAPSTVVDDLLDKGDLLRVQVDLLKEMMTVRKELTELQARQTRIYVDSLESRADRAEEMAVLYHCVTKDGKPLWPSPDDAWNARMEDVEILTLEYQYFRHGITEEQRQTLGKYGFTKRLSATSDSSADSPVQPDASSAGESVTSLPPTSSEDTA
jgi:hypothetical protein